MTEYFIMLLACLKSSDANVGFKVLYLSILAFQFWVLILGLNALLIGLVPSTPLSILQTETLFTHF